MKPLHEHDCQGCIYLGTDKRNNDWYVCGKGEDRTLIRRFSSEPSEYASWPIARCVELGRLEKLAARMGFKFNDYEIIRFGKLYLEENTRPIFGENDENFPEEGDEDLLSQEGE